MTWDGGNGGAKFDGMVFGANLYDVMTLSSYSFNSNALCSLAYMLF